MTQLEQIQAWLETCPGMERISSVQTDSSGTAAGSGGIFPLGLTELERKEDILGNTALTMQERYQIRYTLDKTEGDEAEANAAWLLELQQWVQEESAQGRLPFTGGGERCDLSASAEKGRLYQSNEGGTATYTVVLTIKYKESYEV